MDPAQTDIGTQDAKFTPRRRSRWWYLLPILFGIIGGVIAYFVLKDDDRKMAKNCLWLSIILTIISFIIGLIIGLIIGINHYERSFL